MRVAALHLNSRSLEMVRSPLLLSVALALAASGAASDVSAAADYPKQPIQIVVPFTPGGNTDLLARIMAERLQAGLKETVTVVNRPGAGTNIGAAAVASSSPDGYTIFIGPPASFVVNQFIFP